jgi:hypothetical protein
MSACAILILFLILTIIITNGSFLSWFYRPRRTIFLSEPERRNFNEYVSRDIRLNRTVNPTYGQPLPSSNPTYGPASNPTVIPVMPASNTAAMPVLNPTAMPVLNPPVMPTINPAIPVPPPASNAPVGVSSAQPLASSCNWSDFIDGEPEQTFGAQFDLTSVQTACDKEPRCEHVSTMKDAKGSDLYLMGSGTIKPSTRGMRTAHCTRKQITPQTKTGGRY